MKNESGQDLAEYALLLGFIAVVVFVAVMVLGESIKYFFGVIGEQIGVWL